jgi:3-carboxy-cis,cis-muconate cycloisomerase
MVQDHERATGLWHAEWEALSSIIQLAAGCLNKATEVTNRLEVRKVQMLAQSRVDQRAYLCRKCIASIS